MERLPLRSEVQVLDRRKRDLRSEPRAGNPMEGSLVHDSRGRPALPGKPLALHDVQSKPLTFSIKRNRAEIGYSRKFRRTKDGIISASLQGVQTGDKFVAQRTNRQAQESRAGAHSEYDRMRVLVLLHPFADSPARQALRKQSQTRCPRCGAWSAADRCPQCGAHRMSAEITVHPEEEEEMQVAR